MSPMGLERDGTGILSSGIMVRAPADHGRQMLDGSGVRQWSNLLPQCRGNRLSRFGEVAGGYFSSFRWTSSTRKASGKSAASTPPLEQRRSTLRFPLGGWRKGSKLAGYFLCDRLVGSGHDRDVLLVSKRQIQPQLKSRS